MNQEFINNMKNKAVENLGYISDPVAIIGAIKNVFEILEIAERLGEGQKEETVQATPVSQNMGSEDKARTSDNLKRPAPQKAETAQAAPTAEQNKPKLEVVSNGWTEELRKEAQPAYDYFNNIAAQPGGKDWLNNLLSQFTSGLYQDYADPNMPPQTFKAFCDVASAELQKLQKSA